MRNLLVAAVILLVPMGRVQAETVTGRVVGPDEKPVAGAQVVIIRYVADGDRREYVAAQSDASGKFVLELKDQKEKSYPGTLIGYKTGVGSGHGRAKAGENVLRLEVPTTARGLIKDKSGKPVANVTIRLKHILSSMSDLDAFDYWEIPESLQGSFTTKSDAEGRWAMADLPSTGRASFQLEDARFVHTRLEATLSPAPVEVRDIIVQPGAVITGRVVYEDGKPVVGARVAGSASDYSIQSWGEARTGTDGMYRLEGLAAGPHKLFAHVAGTEWVLLQREKVETKAGQEVAAPRLIMTHGAIIEGRVTDAQSGAPIPDVSIGSAVKNENVATTGGRTDEQGRYRLRISPGKQGVYVMGKPQEYLYPEQGSPTSGIPMTVQKNETKTLDFTLRKGLVISGVVVDETNKPVPELRLSIRAADDRRSFDYYNAPTAKTDGAGKLKIVGIVPGSYRLVADGDWEVKSPTQVNPSQAGEVRIVLRKQISLKATGRVMTRTGEPIAGAEISAMVLIPQGGGSFRGSARQVKSDTNGGFAVEGLQPDYRVNLQVSKTGYRYLSGGKVTSKDGSFTIENIVMIPQAAQIGGIVTAPGGEPVAGVQVAAPDGGGKRVVTDAAGKFKLDGLAEGEVTLVAAHRRGAATARRRTGQDSYTLVLQPPMGEIGVDEKKAREILADVWETSRGSKWYERRRVPALLSGNDRDAALQMAREADGTVLQSTLHELLETTIKEAPSQNAEWVVAHLGEVKDPYSQLMTASSLALAVFAEKPELSATLYENAKKIAIPAESTHARRYQPFILAALATRLGKHDEAQQWFRQGLAQLPAENVPGADPGTGRHDILGAVAETAARGGASLAEWTVESIDEKDYDARAMALRRAIPELATYDLPSAQRLLQQLKEIGGNQADFAFGDAALNVIDAVGPSNPQAALALARQVEHEHFLPEALLHAAAFQPKDSALALLREAADAVPAHYWTVVGILSRIGGRAYQLDAAAGTAILEKAHTLLKAKLKEDEDESLSSWRQQNGAEEVAALTFHYSRIDPVESRLLIEEEFAYQNQVVPEDRRYGRTINLVLAMATIDPTRARELARQISSGINAQFSAELKLAEFLLTAPEKRETLLSRF